MGIAKRTQGWCWLEAPLWKINMWLRLVGLVLIVSYDPHDPSVPTTLRITLRSRVRSSFGGTLVGDKGYQHPTGKNTP
jgi:hypothetical protein